MSSLEEIFEECECDCHGSLGTVMHCVPCCETCPYCKKRIRYSADSHMKRCSFNPAKLVAEWNKEHPEAQLKCMQCGSLAVGCRGEQFVCGTYPKCVKQG